MRALAVRFQSVPFVPHNVYYMKYLTKKNFGFTLIELLVVISIIGLLSSITLASLSQARLKANDSRILQDLKSLSTEAALYYDSHGNSYDNMFCSNSTPPCTGATRAYQIYSDAYNLGGRGALQQNWGNAEVCTNGDPALWRAYVQLKTPDSDPNKVDILLVDGTGTISRSYFTINPQTILQSCSIGPN